MGYPTETAKMATNESVRPHHLQMGTFALPPHHVESGLTRNSPHSRHWLASKKGTAVRLGTYGSDLDTGLGRRRFACNISYSSSASLFPHDYSTHAPLHLFSTNGEVRMYIQYKREMDSHQEVPSLNSMMMAPIPCISTAILIRTQADFPHWKLAGFPLCPYFIKPDPKSWTCRRPILLSHRTSR